MLQLCKITDSLFIGNARSGCSAELIQQEAVTFCINVSKQQPFPTVCVATLRIPVYDDPNEDLYSHFDRCADAIQQEANRGGHSVVYCKNGRSRSASVCVAYLMKHQKLSMVEALQKVKAARHAIDPNAGFMIQLQKYEQELYLRRRGVDQVHVQA
ncbi:dual specificity phosphatase 28 [Thalassophryne amazonica]|uniref:dual specificity phosphatase 28 n=1 Tax=Thalassophryne amazonica TaxID=390379 RepID=UPI00147127E8|nr:dual specificity phosphatase 28 [Thalassophryne amazonica]XP_034039235.1 dual specificity phosphatase 28 [Thalassophryne amazonica]